LRLLPDQDAVVLKLEDDGPGLPMPASKGQGAGWGVGVAITAAIAARFGAKMQVAPGATGKGLLASVRRSGQT
jgi:C4-dicarboxylate-specific signal transduction histidine kinase